MSLSRNFKLGLAAFLLVDLALVVVFLTLWQVRSERQEITQLRNLGVALYPEPMQLADFSLTDQRGEEFTASDFRGTWNLVFFGFTSCPDICPLTMAELKQFYAALAPDAQAQVRVIMVSVDPERDTSAAMADYVASYNGDFIGLTGYLAAITGLARQFFVAHSDPGQSTHGEHGSDSGDYLIEHSGHIGIVNPEGQFAGVMQPPIRDRDLSLAYQTLLQR